MPARKTAPLVLSELKAGLAFVWMPLKPVVYGGAGRLIMPTG